MNFKIVAMNLIVPLFVILVIAVTAGCFRIKRKESVKGEIYDHFVQAWNAGEKGSDSEESFFGKFFKMFIQMYEYEKYKESANKLKYYFYKLLALFVLLCIPFLALFLITRKEWLLNDSEWNDIYLYTSILIPLIFAYLVNKYVRLKQYHETWYRHLRNRHYMEWRMMEFVKDYELLKAGMKPAEPAVTTDSLKVGFINDMCEYWKAITAEIAASAAKEENLFDDISSLLGKK